LDFDDLEAGALALLRDPHVRAARQAETRAVLVDEFQDTNERQREIVYALTGFEQRTAQVVPPAVLFVVGDAKQSIYRFRGADVTVFRRVQDDMARAGGRTVALDLTFRTHGSLVETANRLLAPALDELARPGRLYAVPFAPLAAHRAAPRPGIAPPFVQFLLGLGESAALGRQAAAEGLALHLHALHAQEGVEWKDVALLFRASTTFSVYEDALDRAGIPFVTVAGRGFYERYEVRDLLNALLAASDPSDDLALVGFLRSPAVGLSDAALYRLRFPSSESGPRAAQRPCAIWSVLNSADLPAIVPPDELAQAVRGRELLAELHGLAGRVPVATLLKRLLDRTGYRAALGSAAGGARALRNVDKLLADAHTSGLVSVRAFLEYVRVLRDVGARESEAPTEAGSAVQLMTVHKAKGLEFPVVVIADAAHAGHGSSDDIRLGEQTGVTLNLRASRGDSQRPAAHRLAALHDRERDEAENRRLLYVALTRAEEKVLVSAHTKLLKGGQLSLGGWLQILGQAAGLDELPVPGLPAEPHAMTLGEDIGCTLYPWHAEGLLAAGTVEVGVPQEGTPIARDLVAPLVVPPSEADAKLRQREAQPPRRVWRVVPTSKRPQAPAWVVGTLVHTALRHWCFDETEVEAFLRPSALEMGLVDEAEIHAAIGETKRILRRFRAHPLWAELDAAERWHEVPFSIGEGERVEHGVIDLLYRVGETWKIAEFKTDRLESGEDLAAHVQREGYAAQVQRYERAVRQQLGVAVAGALVFLNVAGEVVVF
ncbi:MAG: UvrD-helicase domain-containing protein, partial [Anaerolineae bacterium]|nr:UvrD-helicase domain-containing protein [Anaerolineae bacterium]